MIIVNCYKCSDFFGFFKVFMHKTASRLTPKRKRTMAILTKNSHIKMMCIIAAPEGVERLAREHPDVEIYCGCVDERLIMGKAVFLLIPGSDREHGEGVDLTRIGFIH